jgi:hypothetical protein
LAVAGLIAGCGGGGDGSGGNFSPVSTMAANGTNNGGTNNGNASNSNNGGTNNGGTNNGNASNSNNGGTTNGEGNAAGTLEIRTLSNRADLISDGDALVSVTATGGATFNGLKITVGTRDVTSAFTIDGNVATGLVTDLADGSNELVATATKLARDSVLTITNAPKNKPVVSGPYTMPYYCATPTAVPGDGVTRPATLTSGMSGVAAQDDPSCTIPTEYKLQYRNTAGTFVAYNPAAARPANMSTTTTDEGKTVDFIVRVERGTINRGIYDMAVLVDPTQLDASDLSKTPKGALPAWSGKVWFNFGSSTGQPRRQTQPASSGTSFTSQLGRGYLVAVNSMTDSLQNSNRVLMSETVMRMKERMIEQYGPVKFAIGSGCSGGSINSNMNASIMPGLLDGVITTCTYPDSESTSMEVGDCVGLVEAYQKPGMLALWNSMGLTQAQINTRKAAINGHVDQTACHGWFNTFGDNGRAGLYRSSSISTANHNTGVITRSATVTNNCQLPNTAVFDPDNAAATKDLPRCGAWGWATSIWGSAPDDNNAGYHTRDNVGVQYGLKALRDGAISAEEFVAINELIGGSSRDSVAIPTRTVADASALETAYRSGIVMSGKQLSKTAMIDLRGWDDSLVAANVPPGITFLSGLTVFGIHHTWYSFGIRDRIVREAGDAGNQAMWRFTRPSMSGPAALVTEAQMSMDSWLTALKADTSSTPLEQKVRNARPASTADRCYINSDTAFSSPLSDMAACDAADRFLVPSLSPRQVAGGPRSEDVLKCQLKPLVADDYASGTFSASQWARLGAVFPSGVCDWSKPGVGQQLAISWLTFKNGPGGQPLPAAPVSVLR